MSALAFSRPLAHSLSTSASQPSPARRRCTHFSFWRPGLGKSALGTCTPLWERELGGFSLGEAGAGEAGQGRPGQGRTGRPPRLSSSGVSWEEGGRHPTLGQPLGPGQAPGHPLFFCSSFLPLEAFFPPARSLGRGTGLTWYSFVLDHGLSAQIPARGRCLPLRGCQLPARRPISS